jgi:anionic cell wall polymer biosynthesis LytR-Cps2A-Psr (LCP) family protein
MDEPGLAARTDVLVVADPSNRRLLWIPRDLWCESIGDRVNEAYRLGGADALLGALAEHGIRSEHVICVGREVTEAALEGIAVTVFVRERMEFLYPLPGMTVPEGNRRVVFDPPAEKLSGERIHEWLGARFKPLGGGSDLERIERQKLFLLALLESGFDFAAALRAGPAGAITISSSDALAELGLKRV